MLALTTYPLAFPQMIRLVTGLSADAPAFQERWTGVLRTLAARLRDLDT